MAMYSLVVKQSWVSIPSMPLTSLMPARFQASVTVLRTWGGASPLPTGQTYAGAEFEFSVARVNMGVGILHRVDGDEGRDLAGARRR